MQRDYERSNINSRVARYGNKTIYEELKLKEI